MRYALFPTEPTDPRVGAQQVDLLFKNVAPGVIGAALANLALEGILLKQQALDPVKGLLWAGYILACMSAHLALLALYRKKAEEANWRRWAMSFTLISLVEGLGWGWAPVYLVDPGHAELQLIVVCVTMVIATGAITAFGSYLPAFFALFLPASLPFAIAAPFEPDVGLRLASFLMPIYVLAMPVLAVQTSQKFKELVALRLKSSELADELRSQIELVEQAMIAKANFLAAASHDLRQPVHAIGLFAGALREMRLPEAGERLTGQIENSVVALDGLFGALLDISRLDARTVEVRRSAFAIEPLLARICEDFAAEAAAKSLQMRWLACGARIYTDPILLERILRNLVSNAVRYTESGKVLVGCRRRANAIEIQICDTGLGIAPEHRDLVFKEYFQLHNPERDRQKGLGLGLAIVQRLVKLLESSLSVRSELGRGSCFSLRAPLAAAQAAQPEKETDKVVFGRENGMIAVVDDELPILSGMTILLEAWGYMVVGGGSGEEVVAKLARSPSCPDLIISDHWLRDGENGLDVVERLRAEFNEEIPALLISGDTSPELRAQAQAIGAVLLHKPTPNGKLRAAISHSLAATRRQAAAAADRA